MSRDRLLRIEAMFLACLALPEEERTEYLDAVCGDDPRLRTELEELLAWDEVEEAAKAEAVAADAAAAARRRRPAL